MVTGAGTEVVTVFVTDGGGGSAAARRGTRSSTRPTRSMPPTRSTRASDPTRRPDRTRPPSPTRGPAPTRPSLPTAEPQVRSPRPAAAASAPAPAAALPCWRYWFSSSSVDAGASAPGALATAPRALAQGTSSSPRTTTWQTTHELPRLGDAVRADPSAARGERPARGRGGVRRGSFYETFSRGRRREGAVTIVAMSDANQPNAALDNTRKPVKNITWVGWIGVAGAYLAAIARLLKLGSPAWRDPVLWASLGLLVLDWAKQTFRSWLGLRRYRKEQAEQERRKG